MASTEQQDEATAALNFARFPDYSYSTPTNRPREGWIWKHGYDIQHMPEVKWDGEAKHQCGIERVGSRLWWRSCSILLSRKMWKYIDNKKNWRRKICDSKPLSHGRNTEFEFPVKAQLYAPNSAPTMTDYYRNPSLNDPVERPRFFCMFPAC